MERKKVDRNLDAEETIVFGTPLHTVILSRFIVCSVGTILLVLFYCS